MLAQSELLVTMIPCRVSGQAPASSMAHMGAHIKISTGRLDVNLGTIYQPPQSAHTLPEECWLFAADSFETVLSGQPTVDYCDTIALYLTIVIPFESSVEGALTIVRLISRIFIRVEQCRAWSNVGELSVEL